MSRQKGDIMRASDRLLNLNIHYLVVFRDINDNICVHYENCEYKDGCVLVANSGRGRDFEEACEDYLRQISGKTLVFDACTDKRKEVVVL